MRRTRCAARLNAASTMRAQPSSPSCLKSNQSLSMSALRPHWIVLSPTSRFVCSLSGWKRYAAFTAFADVSAPLCRVMNTAACSAAPSCLCADQANESAQSTPSRSTRCAGEKSAPPPQAASTCIHNAVRVTLLLMSALVSSFGPAARSLRQMTAIAFSGSKPPRTVVPAVAPTKKGTRPAAHAESIAIASACGSMPPQSFDLTKTRFFDPNPINRADLR
mmetsp:Transcript_117893/g.328402  ORF Transcript_117893/g.328402 Transcript_117893/m.328402 type:complete len:220 (-) Transcript_117893:693-1352(-)